MPENTEWGVYGEARGQSGYEANLPYGMRVYYGGGFAPGTIVDAGGKPTGLTWDHTTGHVVGGDDQLDNFSQYTVFDGLTVNLPKEPGFDLKYLGDLIGLGDPRSG
jgi:hypothetical protein